MLADWTARGFKFEVPVFDGKKEVWAEATAALVRNVDKLVVIEAGKHKYKVSAEHKFLCLRTPSTRGREGLLFNEYLAWMHADQMKAGDRLYYPEYNNLARKDLDKQDRISSLGFVTVSKARTQELSEPVPVYCLTVPRWHHFLLPQGIVSANCHINSLLLTLFYKYLPELFSRGMVYVSAAPEFYSTYKAKGKVELVYGDTLSVVQKKLKKNGAPASTAINHLKGWGEAGKNLMNIFAANPETRHLIQIQAIEKEDHVEFVKLMNDDVEYRRDMLGLPKAAKAGEEEAPVKKTVAKKAPAKKFSKLKKGMVKSIGPISNAIRKFKKAA
jgi:hypothetical protein